MGYIKVMGKTSLLLSLLILSCASAVYGQTALPQGTPQATTVSGDKVATDEVVSRPDGAGTVPTPNGTVGRGASVPQEKARPVRMTRFAEPPTIDGRLNEAAWRDAAVLKDFYQTQPGDNIAPSQPTEVLIGYDPKNLYIGFRAHDEKGKVVASVARRDAIFEDDTVSITLDTYNDQRRGYVLVFNPYGVQADAVFTEGRGEDYSVDIVMTSKGVIDDDGYTVEVAIPFTSLRYKAGPNALWGIHAFRTLKRFNNEQDSWMPLAREASGLLNQAGRITGFEGLASQRTLELIPSLTLSETGRRVRSVPSSLGLVDEGRFVNEPLGFDPGLTAKLGITPTITLDFALNPDFAQVEADVPVVTANQRFPIFFAEKRPFFLEGIDVFQTPLTPVHTRAIIDPDAAVKLTGKHGRNTFGVLLASDNAPGNFIGDERLDPRNARFLDKNAYIGIVRLKRDIGKENFIGAIATGYSFIERHNFVGGFDGRFRFDPQTTLDFQLLGTTSRRFFFEPTVGNSVYRTGNGLGYSFTYDHSARHLGYTLSGFGRTRDYRADVGFTLRTNTNEQRLNVRYNSEPHPKATLVSYRLSNTTTVDYDWQRRSQNLKNDSVLLLNFQRQGFIQTGFTNGYERLVEEEFGTARTPTQLGAFSGDDSERSAHQKTVYAYGQVTPSRKYTIFLLGLYQRGAFDYDLGAPPRFDRVSPAALLDPNAPQLDPGPGNLSRYEFTFIYQPTAELRASFNFNKSHLVRQDNGRLAFDDNISILRVTYQFTRFTFLRTRIDHTTLSGRVRAQLLLGWAPNPGTSFYVGYNDDMNRNGYNPFTGLLEPGFRRNGRTFFVKTSYLFRRGL